MLDLELRVLLLRVQVQEVLHMLYDYILNMLHILPSQFLRMLDLELRVLLHRVQVQEVLHMLYGYILNMLHILPSQFLHMLDLELRVLLLRVLKDHLQLHDIHYMFLQLSM